MASPVTNESLALQLENSKRANGNIEVVNPDDQLGDFYLTHGDYILVTMTAKDITLGGAAIE